VKSLEKQTKLFLKEYRKYMHFHGRQRSNEGHFQEVNNARNGVRNRLDDYQDKKCDDDSGSFQRVLERSRHFVTTPIPEPALGPDDDGSGPRLPLPPPPGPSQAAGMSILGTLLVIILVIA
jgi:hypothetical protein